MATSNRRHLIVTGAVILLIAIVIAIVVILAMPGPVKAPPGLLRAVFICIAPLGVAGSTL